MGSVEAIISQHPHPLLSPKKKSVEVWKKVRSGLWKKLGAGHIKQEGIQIKYCM